MPSLRPSGRRVQFGRLRGGLVEVQRRDELFDVLDLEQSALMLVMGSPRIRSPTLWRLAIAEVEELGLLLGSAMSS
jgi:hypothetical protein